MSGSHAILLPWLLWWRPVGYAVIFFGMMIEGDALLFTAAFLTHQRFFDFGDMALVVLAGVFVGDLLWYQLGIWLAQSQRFAWVHHWLERLTSRFDEHLSKRPWHTLFLSKFAYGLHHPILMRAGAIGIHARKFLRSDILASLAWIAIVGGLGYASSASLPVVRHRFRFAERALLVSLVAFFLFEWFVRRSSKKRL